MREYKEMYKYEQYKEAQSHNRKTLSRAGGLEGWGSGRSAGDSCYRCASQVSNWENPHAPSSETRHENPGELELPGEW